MSYTTFDEAGIEWLIDDDSVWHRVTPVKSENVVLEDDGTCTLDFLDLVQYPNGWRGKDGLLYKSEMCYDWWVNFSHHVPLKDKKVYHAALQKPEVPSTQTNRPPAERTTFLKALEDAFWEANGPQLLVGLAQTNPLEFLKICAKLVDPSAKQPNAGLNISFNISAEERVVAPIEPSEKKALQ